MYRSRMYLAWVIVHQLRIRKQPLLSVKSPIIDLKIIFVNFICIISILIFFYSISTAAGQVGVLHKNIHSFLKGQPLTATYDGYASCPLVTGYDSCIMAEFDYTLQPKETFPFRQDCERYSMFVMKRDILPPLYWKLMLNGNWNGPAFYRKCFAPFKRRPSNA